MKVLIDMNLSPLWVEFLSGAGFESVHWSRVGSAKASDAEIMEYARINDFVILTHDLDFGAMLASRRSQGPSVVQLRSRDVLPMVIGQAVLQALLASQAEIEAGALLTVDVRRQRIALLPLR